MIYLDNAATTGKKPQAVINAVNNALKNLSANPGRSGHNAAQRAADAVYGVRQKTADFFGAEGAEQVIFTAGCTASINYVLKGVLKSGDHLIVSNLEHNAVMRPITKMGISYDLAEVSHTDDMLTLENFSRLIKPNTKMIFCTGASNVSGKRLPIWEIGALCKARGILFAVDAAQIAGVVPINMQKMNIDYLCVAGHKGLYAPMGVGILIARKPILTTVIEGGTGNGSANLVQGTLAPEDFESGTQNLSGIMGIGAGIDFVKQKGIDNIHRYEMSLIKRLYRNIENRNDILLYTKSPQEESFVPVLCFNIIGKTSGQTAKILNEKGIATRAGLHCAPMAHKALGTLENGAVRIAPSVFNTVSEIDFVAKTIKSVKKL